MNSPRPLDDGQMTDEVGGRMYEEESVQLAGDMHMAMDVATKTMRLWMEQDLKAHQIGLICLQIHALLLLTLHPADRTQMLQDYPRVVMAVVRMLEEQLDDE